MERFLFGRWDLGFAKICCLASAILLELAPTDLLAARMGAIVRLQMDDGRLLQGQLLAIRGEELLLSDVGREVRADFRHVERYCIVRKNRGMNRLGRGMLRGLVAGIVLPIPFAIGKDSDEFGGLGFMYTAGLGLTLGTAYGLIDALSAKSCQYKSYGMPREAWIKDQLARLRKYARFRE